MNTSRDLLKRLLHLYPVKVIKDYFQESGSVADIIEDITGNKTGVVIKTFANQSYLYTRQNIFLYRLSRSFNPADIGDAFPFKIEYTGQIGNEYSYFLLPKTVFTVYLSNPTDKEDLIFYQPVMVRISNRNLIIHFTKLNKNEKYYYPEDRFPKKSVSTLVEDDILQDIVDYFSSIYNVTTLDINAGVKHLWEIDSVDCVRIQWRLPHSINTATMDESLTFKQKYPNEYKDIVSRPLGKTTFVYLKDDEILCSGFTVDPTDGYISITSSPKLPNQVTNVISEILANNK